MRRFLLLALLAGCAQRTELMLGVITDINAPNPLDTAHLQVFANGDITQPPKLDISWNLGSGLDRLPGSFALNSGDGNANAIEVLLTAERTQAAGQQVLVTRRAKLSLVGGKVLFMRMALVGACMNRSDCAATETCREGLCVDKQVDATTLPPFDPMGTQVTAVECGAAQFRDTQTGNSIVNATVDTPGAPECNGGACIEGTCYLPPQGSSHGGNSADAGTTSCGVPASQCAQCNAQVAAGNPNACQMLCVSFSCAPSCCGDSGGTADMGVFAPDLGSGMQTLMIKPNSATVAKSGGTVQLQAILMPSGQDVTMQVMWTSTNPAIASVQTAPQASPGLVTGGSAGTVQIRARLNSPPVMATTLVTSQ